MGFLEEAEKIAGAVIAVEGVKKVDPNASILTEYAAAVAGFEGAGAIAGAPGKIRKRQNNGCSWLCNYWWSHKGREEWFSSGRKPPKVTRVRSTPIAKPL